MNGTDAAEGRQTCLMVLTRDFPRTGQTGSGRERIVAGIRDALDGHVRVVEFPVRSFAEHNRTLAGAAGCLLHLSGRLLRLRPAPLQTAIFHDPHRTAKLLETITRERPASVYFDSVRCLDYIEATRKAFPDLHIVCDFDDLMSRRMQLLASDGRNISAGYLSRHVPSWIQRWVLSGPVSRLLSRYESRCLARAEERVCHIAQRVVLNAPGDAAPLEARLPPPLQLRVTVIPPSSPILRKCAPGTPTRFVFLGSDALTQNRLTIRWLLDTWKALAPGTPLHIYGRMQRHYPDVPQVTFAGFAQSLDEVYTPGSLLLAPAFLGGGIKTKVLEAISHGTPVIGNPLAFEGLGVPATGLAFSEPELHALIQAPARHLDSIFTAATQLQEACRLRFDPAAVSRQWRDTLAI